MLDKPHNQSPGIKADLDGTIAIHRVVSVGLVAPCKTALYAMSSRRTPRRVRMPNDAYGSPPERFTARSPPTRPSPARTPPRS